jgi:hypothetical protein
VPPFIALGAFARGPATLRLNLRPAGFCIGAAEPMSTSRLIVSSNRAGRRIMNLAHACWSVGFFGAGLLGALAARAGSAAQSRLAAMPPLTLLPDGGVAAPISFAWPSPHDAMLTLMSLARTVQSERLADCAAGTPVAARAAADVCGPPLRELHRQRNPACAATAARTQCRSDNLFTSEMRPCPTCCSSSNPSASASSAASRAASSRTSRCSTSPRT